MKNIGSRGGIRRIPEQEWSFGEACLALARVRCSDNPVLCFTVRAAFDILTSEGEVERHTGFLVRIERVISRRVCVVRWDDCSIFVLSIRATDGVVCEVSVSAKIY